MLNSNKFQLYFVSAVAIAASVLGLFVEYQLSEALDVIEALEQMNCYERL